MAAYRIAVPLPFMLAEAETGTTNTTNSAVVAALVEEESNPTDAVIFFGVSLILGIACRHFLRGTRIPYTVALLVIGIGLGSLGMFYAIAFFSIILVSILLDFRCFFESKINHTGYTV